MTERLPPVGPSALVTASGKPNPEVMAIRARSSAPGSAPAGRSSEVEQWAAKRQLYVDNLKVILIAAVIAGHAILGYSELDAWSYADVREVTLRPAVAYVPARSGGAVRAAGDPPAVSDRGTADPTVAGPQGPRAFIRDRLLRLGVPFAVFALLLWPLLEYVLFRRLGEAPGLWTYFRAEGAWTPGSCGSSARY